MKLTSREKVLLIVLGVVALLGLSYYFVIAPQLDKFRAVGEDLITVSQQVETVKAEINSIPQLENEINDLKNEITAASEGFYPDLIQKKFIVILNDLLAKSGVKADSVDFSQPNIVESIAASTDGSEQNGTQTEAQPADGAGSPQIRYMSIQLPIAGTYEQIMNFIKQLESQNRMIVINNLQLAQGTDGVVNGSARLDFYSLDKVSADTNDDEFNSWPYNSPKGVNNPFRLVPSNEQAQETFNDQPEADGEQAANEGETAEGNESTQTP